MWNIVIKSKQDDNRIQWIALGFDKRPLIFTDKAVAEREAHLLNQKNDFIFSQKEEGDLYYAVVENGTYFINNNFVFEDK